MLEIKPPRFTMGRIVATSNAMKQYRNPTSSSDYTVISPVTGATYAQKIVRPMTWRC